MRAFHSVTLILLNTWYLVNARLPYIKSSGYYSPFPPKENRVIYEFSPLPEPMQAPVATIIQTEPAGGKSRETRDLAWREFDAFLNGEEEPSCADLRRMWRLARKLQQEAIESNEIPSEMHPFKAASAGSYSTTIDKSSRRREEPNQALQSNKELQRKKFSSAVSDKADTVAVNDEEPSEETPDQVYGIVKTHAPPQAPQVRDPTKEILSGLWRSTSSRSLPSQMSQTQNSPASSRFHHTGGKKHFQPYFGRIRTHSPSSNQIGQSSEPISKLELLRNELYGGSRPDKSSQQQSEVYGTVHHRFNPNAAGDSSSLDTKLDLVRSILAKEEGTEVNEESKNAFDRIRDKLLNSRNHRVRPPKERNLRRKGSKKRRRNAEEIAVIKDRLFNDYVKTMPRFRSLTDEEKKRRRRQKNRKNKSGKQFKKWKISRDKIREQNLLLKKLGK